MYKRKICQLVEERLKESRKFISILLGPRQVGKTTLINQVLASLKFKSHYASADEISVTDRVWINQQWNIARLNCQEGEPYILVIDEIQKIDNWSETVKKLWDEDTRNKTEIRVVILGSSQLLIQKGLSESLAGRFEVIPVTHWSYNEMKDAFDYSFDEYMYFGGYPGAVELIKDEDRWKAYILESIINTTISKDILMITRVDKPVLLRNLFNLSCLYSSQILSYNKMLGQLQDVGNVTTLAQYLSLLDGAGMVGGISKFSTNDLQVKGSSPKLQVYNTALINAVSDYCFQDLKKDMQYRGRLYESTFGAYLMNLMKSKRISVYYYRNRDKEVDFILKYKKKIVAIEVKSGAIKEALSGIRQFCNSFDVYKTILIGQDGMSIEDFMLLDVDKLFE